MRLARHRARKIAPRTRSTISGPILRTRAYGLLWVAAMQSLIGDQIARVALAELVFRATHSPLATAGAYALTFLPGLAAAGLGHLADTWPRRRLMVACDVLRAALFALMALPGLPVVAVCALIAVAVTAGAPFQAASVATVADLFTADRYRRAVAIRQAGGQAAQLIGFAVGGVLVGTAGARGALLVDAATFVVSAVLVQAALIGVPTTSHAQGGSRSVLGGLRAVVGDRDQRLRLMLLCLVGFWIVPECLAVPYADAVGAGSVGVGLLFAALPTGFVIGSAAAHRVPGTTMTRLCAPLAVGAGVPLALCVTAPPLGATLVLWTLAGAATTYVAVVLAEYISAAPVDGRGNAAGLASAAGLTAQGMGALAGGAVAIAAGPTATVAMAGIAGSACAALVSVSARRQRQASVAAASPRAVDRSR